MTYGCIESFKLFKTGLRATKTETVKSWDRPRHASSHTHTFNMLRTRQHTFAVSPERRGGGKNAFGLFQCKIHVFRQVCYLKYVRGSLKDTPAGRTRG